MLSCSVVKAGRAAATLFPQVHEACKCTLNEVDIIRVGDALQVTGVAMIVGCVDQTTAKKGLSDKFQKHCHQQRQCFPDRVTHVT